MTVLLDVIDKRSPAHAAFTNFFDSLHNLQEFNDDAYESALESYGATNLWNTPYIAFESEELMTFWILKWS